ncbi:restriction endonuclease subunit S [Arthrobacter yangruifuii]|uniref:Restriction endonuclease subunit S n=1 Tax=Arthrobacter yangruifuii TaxID=2606616 RepID=A0A5N6MFJ1_9MICC|nr:restriction endonuclease subunit S [Arthrobacter yangruifuii]KAD3515019.1 restriction endonuclease subunit S [Arthrobacter yangruifuii]
MSRIDDLIKEVCPDGVPRRELGVIGTITRGKRFVKADMRETGVPCIHYGEIYTKYGTSATEAFSHLEPTQANRLRHAEHGDVIIASAGETIEDIGKAVAWLGNERVVIHDACYAFRSDLDPKFSAYYFQTDNFRNQIRRNISSSKISAISTQNLARAVMPVPPLRVQQEIVRILDEFTQLETELKAELEAELEARRQQYEHHRTALLESSGAAPHSQLQDLVDMRSGRFIAAAEISSTADPLHPYPCYGGNGLRGYVALCNQIGQKVLIGRQGALSGNVHRVSGEFYATEHAIVVTPREKVEIDIDWAFHMLTAMNLNQYVSQGAQPGLAVGTLKTLTVPLPPLNEQKHVASTLDKLDALVNDLGYGLPAEITARRKQYEYYRDRLLTFKEAAA